MHFILPPWWEVVLVLVFFFFPPLEPLYVFALPTQLRHVLSEEPPSYVEMSASLHLMIGLKKRRKRKKDCWKKFLICSSPAIFYFKMSIFLSFLLPPQIVKLCYSSGGLSSFTIMGNQIWIAVTMTDEFPGQLSVEKTCLSTLKYFLKSSNEYQTCIMTCRLFLHSWILPFMQKMYSWDHSNLSQLKAHNLSKQFLMHPILTTDNFDKKYFI